MSSAPSAPATTSHKQTLTKNQKKKLKKKLKKAALHHQEDNVTPNSAEHAQKPEEKEGVITNHKDTDAVVKGLPQKLARPLLN